MNPPGRARARCRCPRRLLAAAGLAFAVGAGAAASWAETVRLQVHVGDRPPCTGADGGPLDGCTSTRRAGAPFSLAPGESVTLEDGAGAWPPQRILVPGPGRAWLSGPVPAAEAPAWALRIRRPAEPGAPPRIETTLRDGRGCVRSRILRRWPEPGRWIPLLPEAAEPGHRALWIRRLPD